MKYCVPAYKFDEIMVQIDNIITNKVSESVKKLTNYQYDNSLKSNIIDRMEREFCAQENHIKGTENMVEHKLSLMGCRIDYLNNLINGLLDKKLEASE